MLDVKKIYENLTDDEKEELRKLLLSDVEEKNDEISEEPKQDEQEFANAEVLEVKAEDVKEEVVVEDEQVAVAPPEENSFDANPPAQDAPGETTVAEKQDYLVKFGYDPTNVKYMNTDILDQAYDSATKIRAAEAGEQQSSN